MSRYSAKDIAFVIPTKDRPHKLKDLLEGLVAQNVEIGQIVVVDGANSAEEVACSFRNKMNLIYVTCFPAGQIRQRNKGIGLVDKDIKLIGSLDDDIVFENGAIAEMLSFWNNSSNPIAGASFNIVNLPPFKHSRLKGFFGLSSEKQGEVLSSGYAVTLFPALKDLKSDWLCGGATIWKKEILASYSNVEINTAWATGEDLIFSYPIGKDHDLYVVHQARVRHEHQFDRVPTFKSYYQGREYVYWRYYFIESNKELSSLRFIIMILINMFSSITSFKYVNYERCIGYGAALFTIVLLRLRGMTIRSFLEKR